ncbi:hypothetical protein ACIRNY_10890 [Capnocytophaga canimorsus]|uniref:hypothetical protein n=1 Tax=Capnocytophaga canimorsus TaxID=28188 RepID=UPI0037CE84EC
MTAKVNKSIELDNFPNRFFSTEPEMDGYKTISDAKFNALMKSLTSHKDSTSVSPRVVSKDGNFRLQSSLGDYGFEYEVYTQVGKNTEYFNLTEEQQKYLLKELDLEAEQQYNHERYLDYEHQSMEDTYRSLYVSER